LLGIMVSKTTALSMGKYLITANIKVIDYGWDYLSAWVASRENWKRQSEMDGAMVRKAVLVKMVLYFYPYLYMAFVAPFIEGCGDAGPGEGSMGDCIADLGDLILTNYYFAVFFSLIQVLKFILPAWIRIKAEIRSVQQAEGERMYYYSQLQAKCEPAPPVTNDLFLLNMGLGYMTMFAVANPLLPVFAFVTIRIQHRLWAYRNTYASRRTSLGQSVGVGFLGQIPRMLLVPSIASNVGLMFLSYHSDRDPLNGGSFFLGMEHLLILLLGVLSFMSTDAGDDLDIAKQENVSLVNMLLYGKTTQSNLKDLWDTMFMSNKAEDDQRGEVLNLEKYSSLPCPDQQVPESVRRKTFVHHHSEHQMLEERALQAQVLGLGCLRPCRVGSS